MSWNYRLCKETLDKGTSYEDEWFSIREVYYKEDGSISSYSEKPANLFSETREDIKWTLEKMHEALNKEVVDLDTLFR